ncbi:MULTISPECIES: tape measure protein [unclassified Gilliamella]|uniref:tape measure protein n=1 Tax=unclassified Gilliamella TaxID=2685620 RepID=UPI00130D12C4|nr:MULTISPECIES: tape measure protein [unclassified Gilliamella]MWP48526.1 tape measure protein [Gilliamella sp. Lep-s35]MWP68588.1 tape measure protein [Gilliamella sp. Lep-s5]MWP76744.1 tape measure protein [Gilliamella sp. Lep-s21]
MATLRELAIRVTADSSSYQREMSRASRLGTDYYKTMEERSRRFDAYIASNNRSVQALNMQLTQLKSSALSVATAFAGGFAFTSIVNMADDWGQLAVRVKMAVESVNGSASDYENVQDRLLTISNRNAKAIEDSQELYIATASSMKDLGYSIDQTVDFIEAMSNSYTMNATSADKVKVSIDTINKAMITGKITGKQWTQLMSSTSNIASALADSMGIAEKDVKRLGVNGQISMQQLADAMIKVKDETGAMADAMGFTGKDGVTILTNSFKHLIGEFNKSHGITKSLANGLILVANNIELIGIAGVAFTGIGLSRYFGNLSNSVVNATKTTLANRAAQISQAQAQLAAVKSLQLKAVAEVNAARFEAQRAVGLKASLVAQNNLTAAINRQTQANNALTAAQTKVNALTSKFNLLTRAGSGLLGLLGGPVGLLTTAVSVGAAFFAMGDGADKAKKPLEELQLPVDELLARFKELNKGKQQSVTSELTLKVNADSKRVDDEIDNLQKQLEKKFKTAWKANGNYSVQRIVTKEDQSAIHDYIDQFKALKKSYDEGAISKHDFGNKVGELNEKFADAVGKGQEFKTTLGSMTSAVHSSIDALAESKEKLDAVGKASAETAKEVKTLDVADFPNLENQLGVLSQQLDVSKVKSESGAEAAYVLAGLQRAAGDAAIEHAADLIALAKGQELTGKMSEELTEKLRLYTKNLRESFKLQEGFKHSKTIKSAAELYKSQLDKLNSQINAYTDITELQKIRRQLAEGELSKLTDIQKKALESKAIELDKLNAQKEYKSIMDSLRTPAEQQLDTYKQHLSIIEKANLSLKEREEMLNRMAKKAAESAPTFSYHNSYNGLGSDLLNVAEDDKKLQDWHEQQLKLFDDLLKKKEIKQQEYADAIVKIEETMQQKQKDIQSAYTLATIGTFSSLTGSIADMFKETAGESSAAYKAMFVASKAAAIAQAIISTEVAADKALEFDPTGVMSGITRGLGYASVGMIAAQTISGMAHSGIDNIPKEGTWLLDKGERVVDARTNADLKDFLQTSNKSGGNITVNVPVNVGNSGLSEEDGKAVGNMIKQSVLAILEDQIRPGGQLNRR